MLIQIEISGWESAEPAPGAVESSSVFVLRLAEEKQPHSKGSVQDREADVCVVSAVSEPRGCTPSLLRSNPLALLLCALSAESYSVAGSEASLPPSAGSVPPQRSGSSSPCSHSSPGASRHPVSALKKWLANPVRKPNSDAAGKVGKVETEACGPERSPPPQLLLSHAETQPRPLESPRSSTALPSGETVRPMSPESRRRSLLRELSLASVSSSLPVKSVILQVILKIAQRWSFACALAGSGLGARSPTVTQICSSHQRMAASIPQQQAAMVAATLRAMPIDAPGLPHRAVVLLSSKISPTRDMFSCSLL